MKLDKGRNGFAPTLLSTGYTNGQVLFVSEPLQLLTRGNTRKSVLEQLGVMWDIASAPPITLYFFSKEPTGFGAAGTAPAPTFEERASLIGEVSIESADYDTLRGDNTLENAYALYTGPLAVFAAEDDGKEGWLVATIDDAYSATLVDKLRITLTIDKIN